MKKHKLIYYSLLLLLLFNELAVAQEEIQADTSIQVSFASMFDEINTDNIPSGFLYNQTLNYSNVHRFQGNEMDSTASGATWWQLYDELLQAQRTTKLIKQTTTYYDEKLKFFNQEKLISIGAFFTNYQEFNQQQLNDGSITFDAQRKKFHEHNASASFKTYTLAAVSPMLDEVNALDCKFVCNQTDWFNFLPNENIQKIEIDFNDGLGFRTVNWNVIIPISYTNSGNKVIRVKVTTTNHTYQSNSNFAAKLGNVQLAPIANEIIPLKAVLPFNGILTEGELGVYKSCNMTPNLNQPILIVEGFDPTNGRKVSDEKSPDNLYLVGNGSVQLHNNILDSLRAYGHDIVILDFKDGGRRIEENAMLTIAAINYINLHKEGNDELVIIGPSMGTLVSRYALDYMEKNNMDHHCKLWVSFDGPNKGANVPLSFQHFIQFIYGSNPVLPFVSKDKIVHMKEKILDCPAAKQMLIYHYSATSNSKPHPAQEFTDLMNSFQTDFSNNGYPQKCRRVAVADGNGLGLNQGFNPHDVLNEVNIFWPIGVNLTLSSKLWAMPNYSTNAKSLFRGFLSATIFALPVALNTSIVNIKNAEPLDNCPAGSQGFHNLIDVPFLDQLHLGHSIFLTTRNEKDGFVPTISALALTTTNYHFAVNSLYPQTAYKFNYNNFASPFDAMIYTTTYTAPGQNLIIPNAPHVIHGLTPDIYQFAISEIMPRNYYLQNEAYIDNKDFEAITIIAGKNITSNRAVGNYTIKGGSSVEMKAESRICWKDGFSAAAGANVHAFIATGIYDNSCIQTFNNANRLAANADNQIHTAAGQQSNFSAEPKLEMQCYPNPSNGLINLLVNSNELNKFYIEIYNMQNQLVLKNQIKPYNKVELHLNHLLNGVYFLKAYCNEQLFVQKLILQK